MGHTHYWRNTKALSAEFVAAVEKVIAASPVKLADAHGEGGEPEVSPPRDVLRGNGGAL